MHKYYDFLNSEDATQRSLYTGQDHHRLKMTPKPKPEQPPPNLIQTTLGLACSCPPNWEPAWWKRRCAQMLNWFAFRHRRSSCRTWVSKSNTWARDACSDSIFWRSYLEQQWTAFRQRARQRNNIILMSYDKGHLHSPCHSRHTTIRSSWTPSPSPSSLSNHHHHHHHCSRPHHHYQHHHCHHHHNQHHHHQHPHHHHHFTITSITIINITTTSTTSTTTTAITTFIIITVLILILIIISNSTTT